MSEIQKTVPRANDNLPSDIREALAYLEQGGVAEISHLADVCYHTGTQKLESEPAVMLALCILAAEALSARAPVVPVGADEIVPTLREVALKMLRLNEHGQRTIINALGLSHDSDTGLKDYEAALAAVRRADASGRLGILGLEIEKALASS